MQVKKIETALEILDSEKNAAGVDFSSDDEMREKPEAADAEHADAEAVVELPQEGAAAEAVVELPQEGAAAEVPSSSSSASSSSSSKTKCAYCQEAKEVANGTRTRVRSKHKPNCKRRKRALGGGRKTQPR